MNPEHFEAWKASPSRQVWHYEERSPLEIRAFDQNANSFMVWHSVHKCPLVLPVKLAELVPIEGDIVLPVARFVEHVLAHHKGWNNPAMSIDWSIERKVWSIQDGLIKVTPLMPIVPLKCFSVLSPVAVMEVVD